MPHIIFSLSEHTEIIKGLDLSILDRIRSRKLDLTVRSNSIREQDVSAKTFQQKKIRDVSANFSCRNVPYYLGFVFGFLQTGPNQFVENQKQNQDTIPVRRILELKKNDKTINVGMMQSIKRAMRGRTGAKT